MTINSLHFWTSPLPRGCAPRIRFARALAAIATLQVSACAEVSVKEEQSFRAISTKSERGDFSAWQAEASATTRDNQLFFDVSEVRQCSVFTTRSGERVTTTRRENVSPAGSWILGAVGVTGAAALGWGLDQHYGKDEPLTKSGDDGKDTLTGTGYAVYLGAIGSLGLVSAISAAIKSWDTSVSETVEERSTVRGPCERRALAGALLQVWSQDQLLAEGKSDSAGKLSIPCLGEQLELLLGQAEVRVNGARLEKQPFNPENSPESPATEGQPTRLSRVPGSTPDQEQKNERLELFHRALLHAQRNELVDAVLHAGGKQTEQNAHVSSFDVSSLAWPHTHTLKLLFNGHGMFVKARWTGDYAGSRQTELLRALSQSFGPPTRLRRSDGSLVLRWPFSDGLEINFARATERAPRTCGVAELSYVDPVAYAAFEAAVNAATP